jgi:enamine deaminase RidA (YjgF/YER057c/UK114 family)
MQYRRVVAVMLGLTLVLGVAAAKKKKKKTEEEITQTLPLLQDPPSAIVAEAERLEFRVAPLSPKGLLSQQVRDGLKALIRDAHGATIVKIRAFVAGTGDMRRVQTIVSETFTERKLPLPALSTIQGGALPGEGVQVALEAIQAQKKAVNPQGLALISGQAAPSIDKSLEQIQTVLKTLGLTNARVLQTSCFVSSLDGYANLRQAVTTAFPSAAVNFVQLQRVPVRTPVECEAVAALERPVERAVTMLNPQGLQTSPNYSQVALVGPGRLVITGTQLGFGPQEADIRLAFERLRKALDAQHAMFKDVVFARIYPVSDDVAERVRSVRFEFFDKTRPPASTLLPFESLPSLDASFGVEVIAVAR